MNPVNENRIVRDLERQKTTARLQGAGVNIGQMPKFLRNSITDNLPDLLSRRQEGREESEPQNEAEGSEDDAIEEGGTEESSQRGEPVSSELRWRLELQRQGESSAKVLARQKTKDSLKLGGEEERLSQDEGQVTNKLKQGAQMGTAKALAACWKVVYYVLPLIYINFHGIMRYVFKSEYFCRYGEEWQGGGGGLKTGTSAAAATASKTGATMGKDMAGDGGSSSAGLTKQVGGALELLEIWVVILCNLIVLFAIFICLVYIYYMTHPLEAIEIGLKAIGDLFKPR